MRYFLILFGCLLAISVCYANNDLPDLGNPDATYVSSAQERQYGEQFLQALHQHFTIVNDPLIDNYIHDLGFRLVGSTNYSSGLHFAFLVIISPVVNAMAGPNGIIAINSGLILATQTQSELAGVIAHEIAHVTQGHFAAGYAYAKKMTPAMIGMMLASLALATQNPEAGGGALTATIAGSTANALKVKRGHEEAADRIGMQILTQAGFDPHGMPDFFLRLQSQSRYYGSTSNFLSDHPMTEDRIADLTNRAIQLPTTHLKPDLRYRLIRERLRVASAKNARDLVDYYNKNKASAKTTVDKNALKYGYALTLIAMHQSNAGESRLQTLLKSDPNQTIYLTSLAEAYIRDNKPNKAITLLKPALDMNPDYYPMVITYAIALEQDKQYTKAATYLRDQITQFPDYPLLYAVLAKAQASNHQLACAYQNRAKALLMVGNTRAALQQLNNALKLPNLTSSQKMTIKAQIQKLTLKKK